MLTMIVDHLELVILVSLINEMKFKDQLRETDKTMEKEIFIQKPLVIRFILHLADVMLN